jgi:3-oxoacyl-[acyl-carrier-protein] synthase II
MWSALRLGRGVAAEVEGFDASSLPVTIACEVRRFDPTDYVTAREARRLDRAVQLAVGAGIDAVADAGAVDAGSDRCGVVVGTGLGGIQTLLRQLETCLLDSPERLSPLGVPMLMPNAAAANLAMLLGWTGPNLCVSTACAAGAHAIGEAARLVQDGAADVVLAGGTESCVTAFAIGSFWRMGVLSERNDAPAESCRPFDRTRDGFVLGEGAGFVVVEDWQSAARRGAEIHAELVGYGRNCDATHVSSPSPGGAGAALCMELALSDAGIAPSDVCHINAHGTGTELNDEREAQAIVKVFGADAPPVTAPKGVVGHLLGGAGAVEAVAAVLSLEHRLAPPTANFVDAGPEMPLDVVAGEPRALPGGVVLSNSFGFGGHNASLLFGPGQTDESSGT